jgi:hypothetical protein
VKSKAVQVWWIVAVMAGVFLGWVVGHFAATFLFGEGWLMIWYVLDLPFSALLKKSLWPEGRLHFVAVVTLLQAAMLSVVSGLLVRRHFRRGAR